MTTILKGQRFWKHGDHSRVWIVDAIDPTKVMRLALHDAASIAGLMITTEVLVVPQTEPTTAQSAMGHMAA